jgi:hypothetical protein
MNETVFGKAFGELRPNVEKKKRGSKGRQVPTYLGIVQIKKPPKLVAA